MPEGVWSYPQKQRETSLRRQITRDAVRRGVVVPAVSTPAPVTHRACQWIEGQPTRDAVKCGAPVVPGCSWCPAHRARVFEAVRCPT